MLFVRNKRYRTFNKRAFEDFVNIVHKLHNVEAFDNRILFINYKYIGVEYDHLIFKYTINNDGTPACIKFFLPDCRQNRYMDCKMVGGASRVDDAISFIHNLTEGKYAK